VPSKKRLGEAAKIDVAAASVAIVDPGEAAEDMKRIIERVRELRAKAGK